MVGNGVTTGTFSQNITQQGLNTFRIINECSSIHINTPDLYYSYMVTLHMKAKIIDLMQQYISLNLTAATSTWFWGHNKEEERKTQSWEEYKWYIGWDMIELNRYCESLNIFIRIYIFLILLNFKCWKGTDI